MQGKELLDFILNSNKKWIKIDNYEFLYKKLGGKELIKMSLIKDEDDENGMLRINMLLNSIVDWKNVKAKDLVSDFDNLSEQQLNSEVPFSTEAFDVFVGNHLNLMKELFDEVSKIIAGNKEKEEKIKKK